MKNVNRNWPLHFFSGQIRAEKIGSRQRDTHFLFFSLSICTHIERDITGWKWFIEFPKLRATARYEPEKNLLYKLKSLVLSDYSLWCETERKIFPRKIIRAVMLRKKKERIIPFARLYSTRDEKSARSYLRKGTDRRKKRHCDFNPRKKS